MITTNIAVPAPVTPPVATPVASTPAPAPPQPAAGTAPSQLITTTANGSNHGTKVDLQAVYQGLVSGLLALYQSTDTFQMKTGTYTRDELVTQFQGFVGAAENTKSTNQAWRASVQIERELEASVRTLRQGVRGIAQARFGADGAQLMQLGFAPAKAVKKTAASKAEAVVKSKATRVARGTKGKKQKLAVTGETAAAAATAEKGATLAPIAAPAPAAGSTAAPAVPVVTSTAPGVTAASGTSAPHPVNGQ
jgi:hypothetical protein